MNPLEIKGGWDTTEDQRKEQWFHLTDTGFVFVEDLHDELYGRMQMRTGAMLASAQKP
jgi:hypothetical protein